MQLEARPYGPDSTPEEVEAIEARISVLSDGIVMYKEVPVPTHFQLDIFERRLTALGDRKGYRLVIDLSDASPPNAAIRDRLKKLLKGQPLERIAMFAGKNLVLNVAAKFVLADVVGFKNVSVHKTCEEALEALRA